MLYECLDYTGMRDVPRMIRCRAALLALICLGLPCAYSDTLTYTTLDYPGVTETTLTGINNSGTIVGYYSATDTSPYHSFMSLADGTFVDVDPPGAFAGYANGVNNLGTISGTWSDSHTTYPYIRSADGTYSSFDILGATSITSGGINDSGEVVGFYSVTDGSDYGFIRDA